MLGCPRKAAAPRPAVTGTAPLPPRPLLVRENASLPSCTLAVVNAPECRGLVDPDPESQYAVHHWLDRSVRGMVLWPRAHTADVLLNATLSHRHRQTVRLRARPFGARPTAFAASRCRG